MPFDRQDTYAKIVSIIADQLSIDKNSIIEDSSLESLGADSLDRVEIVMNVEEAFGIQIRDEDADTIQTVRQAVDYVQHLRK
ncbi:MAG: acyl carrier protein [Candidatus Babeliaceae bacterium]|jgi:acyl carrier protein